MDIELKILDLESKITVTHISPPTKSYKSKEKKLDWRDTADKWEFKLPDKTTHNYWTGVGHRTLSTSAHHVSHFRWSTPEYNNFKSQLTLIIHKYGIVEFLKCTIPVKPKFKQFLYSLVSDSYTSEVSFDDWCSEMGLDTDSRKALETYLACQESMGIIRKLGFNIQQLREYFIDY